MNQSKELVLSAIYKVVNSAPTLHTSNAYYNGYSYINHNDISSQEFKTWVDYAYQVLDISYNHMRLSFILSEKTIIQKLVNQFDQSGMPYIHRVLQISKELLNLAQAILQC